ncbi:unnamed protein product [Eruca vesicaria subsp. sativa]|uniref:RBR-type E3 ubiquitin transferase n=1 Tax=Eruca vesicaria subsp. sativa TaxID=29727 RepID=A0ABC8JTD1_ERUVS|nr:unnamed protein product [Eruca vesicaria subsp. sativa]
MDYSDDDGMVDTDSGDESLLSDNQVDFDYKFTDQDIDNASTSKRSQISYLVLKEEDISKHQKINIEQVSTVLSISQVEAIVLLLHYQWNVSKVEDEWFTDEEKVRELVGILNKIVAANLSDRRVNIECGICFESYPHKEVATVSCGHPYCNDCWTGYITTSINDGPVCLMVKCPEPSCSAVACQDMINKVIADKEVKEKYYRYFVRSYVEASGNKIKWCRSPGCEYAINFESGSGSEHYDVSCLCSYEFCWNCGEDAHRPVDCDTVSKWISKNSDESENTNWILANTKPCPKCKRQIEKSMGCNNMRCSICKHRFCWNCLCPVNGHKNCHQFKGDNSETDVKRKKAKRAIDRYMHYYERWASNQSSRLIAMADLKKFQSVHLKRLSCRQCTMESQLQFTVEAWRQIIECRRVLKWTYAYGYYLPEEERTKKQFFEYLQGEAEAGLERLHHCAEEELKHFVYKTQDSSKNFNEFRMKLTGLTETTKTYFQNLVKALENGLADVALNESSKSKTNFISATKRRKLK